jgi:hypothetical protein
MPPMSVKWSASSCFSTLGTRQMKRRVNRGRSPKRLHGVYRAQHELVCPRSSYERWTRCATSAYCVRLSITWSRRSVAWRNLAQLMIRSPRFCVHALSTLKFKSYFLIPNSIIDRASIDRLTGPARSIFHSPSIFRRGKHWAQRTASLQVQAL